MTQLLTPVFVASTVWKGQLTFGLVTFPVRLVRAARKERIPLRYIRQTRAPHAEPADELDCEEAKIPRLARDVETLAPETSITPVRQMYSAPGDAEPVAPAELQRGYEVAPGRFAVLGTEELQRLRQPTSSEMRIVRSVRMEEIDPVFLETSYYVHPGAGAEHSYTLFYRALQESNYAALAEVAMHGRQHVIVIRSGPHGLIAHTMYYMNEVRGGEEHVTSEDVPAKELDLAKKFVHAIAAPFQPGEFTDRYREQLETLISSKETVATRAGEMPARAPGGNVIDIMDALRKSLEKVEAQKNETRKPAGRVTSSRKQRRRPA